MQGIAVTIMVIKQCCIRDDTVYKTIRTFLNVIGYN